MEHNIKNKLKFRFGLAKNATIISGLILLIVSTLMIANYIQTESSKPLENKALRQMVEKLKDDPNNENLKEQIRELDLLARKAYFTNQTQIKTGSYILFGSVIVLLISLKSLSSLRREFPELTSDKKEQFVSNRILSKNYFAYGGISIFVLAFAASILTKADVDKAEVKNEVTEDSPATVKVFQNLEAHRSNWPSFRGSEGNAKVFGNEEAPISWDGKSGENIIWKVPVPLKGFNSPVIWNDKLFLSGEDDENLSVFCFDVNDGKLLWRHDFNDIPGTPAERPRVTEYTGYAAATMAVSENRAFVIFGTGDIACVDFEGKRVWAKNIGVPDNHYGHSSSLIVYDKTLLVQYDDNKGGKLLGLNIDTGEENFNTLRNIKISWASPILYNTGKNIEVVLSTNPFVVSYDAESGEELWRFDCMSGEVGPSPVYADGVVYACNDYAKLAAIKIGETPELLWSGEDDLSEVASLAATDSLVVMAASYGTATCYNSKTGEQLWYFDADQGFYSSPIIANGLIYLMEVSGNMNVIKADKKFELVSSNPLGEKASTIPAFYKNKIFIRGEKNLYCIGSKN